MIQMRVLSFSIFFLRKSDFNGYRCKSWTNTSHSLDTLPLDNAYKLLQFLIVLEFIWLFELRKLAVQLKETSFFASGRTGIKTGGKVYLLEKLYQCRWKFFRRRVQPEFIVSNLLRRVGSTTLRYVQTHYTNVKCGHCALKICIFLGRLITTVFI